MPSLASADTATVVKVTGSLLEQVRNIDVNGVLLAQGSWIQTPESITFTAQKTSDKNISVTIYNGAVPILVLSPIPVKGLSLNSPVTHISCSKPGRATREYFGLNRACLFGYTKK